MAIGSDGLGWIDFNDYELARTVGIVALALILFEGGLAAGFHEIRPVLAPGVSLAVRRARSRPRSITGLAAAWLFDLDTLEGLLLGSIVAATDGAAIFAVLRGSTLRRRLARTLEGEAGFNDPVAVLLVLGFIDWIQKPDYGVARHAVLFVAAARHRRGRSASPSAGWRSQGAAARAARVRRPVPGRVARHRRRSRSAPPTPSTAPGSWPSTSPGLVLGSARIPAKRTVTVVPPGPGLGGADHDVPRPRAAGVPEPPRRRRRRGHRARAGAGLRRAAGGDVRRAPPSTASPRRARGARLGRAARRGAGRARHVPGDRPRARQSRTSSTSSSSPSSSRRSCRGRRSSRSPSASA